MPGRKPRGFVLLAAFGVLTSCGLMRPSPSELATADCGPYPSDYQQIIKEHYNRRLTDPYSAVYEFTTPRTAWTYNFEFIYGWGVEGTVNAKNQLGGYAGRESFWIIIRDGQVVSDGMTINYFESHRTVTSADSAIVPDPGCSASMPRACGPDSCCAAVSHCEPNRPKGQRCLTCPDDRPVYCPGTSECCPSGSTCVSGKCHR